jgi:hypothetical protein
MNARRQKRTGVKRSDAQNVLEEQWRSAKTCQPSEMATLAELEACFKPCYYIAEQSNDVVASLIVMLLFTKSAPIARAIQEIIRLGLAGPDWRTRAARVGKHASWMNIEKTVMAVRLLATRASGREIADRIAAQFGGSLSFKAASKAQYRNLHGLGSHVIDFLLKLPLAERRRGIKIARAKLGFGDEEELTPEQTIAVLETLIGAYIEARD